MYESNYTVLRQVIADKSVIRHVSQHRGPDGSFDLDGNKKTWNSALSRFDQTPLWENGAPDYDGRDPLQPQPSIVFIPAQGASGPRSTIIVAHGGGFESNFFSSINRPPSPTTLFRPSLRAPDSTPRSSLTASNPIPAGMRCTTCSVRSVFCVPAATSWVSRIRSPSWGSPQAVC